MERYRNWIGWGAIGYAALSFLPLQTLALPPMQSSYMFSYVPLLGPTIIFLLPMLLFAAGIGLVKGWDGGKKLFAIWAAIAGAAALAGLRFSPVLSVVDLVVLAACIVVVFWGFWRK